MPLIFGLNLIHCLSNFNKLFLNAFCIIIDYYSQKMVIIFIYFVYYWFNELGFKQIFTFIRLTASDI